jgi:serine phosphatase RsbU (regulator of sigma subunit)
LPDSEYHAQRVELAAGEYLVLCSDGVTEAQNRAGELFDDARLRGAVLRADGTARQVVDTIHEAVRGFIGDERPNDDLSIIVLRRTGTTAEPPGRVTA